MRFDKTTIDGGIELFLSVDPETRSKVNPMTGGEGIATYLIDTLNKPEGIRALMKFTYEWVQTVKGMINSSESGSQEFNDLVHRANKVFGPDHTLPDSYNLIDFMKDPMVEDAVMKFALAQQQGRRNEPIADGVKDMLVRLGMPANAFEEKTHEVGYGKAELVPYRELPTRIRQWYNGLEHVTNERLQLTDRVAALITIGRAYKEKGVALATQEPKDKPREKSTAAYIKAINIFQACIKHYKLVETTDALYHLGSTHRLNGNAQGAMEALKQVVERNPDHAWAHFNLGRLWQTCMATPSRAIEHYERVLEISPRFQYAASLRRTVSQLRDALASRR